jgi:hypothetical protein
MNYKILIALVVGAFAYGYFCGCKSTRAEYEETLRELKADNAQEMIKVEREFIIKRDKIEQSYLEQLDREKAENERIKNELESAKFADTVKPNSLCKQDTSGARMPTKTSNKSDLICYTKSELQRKVAASLDIANECDKLAVKYNSLLELCK